MPRERIRRNCNRCGVEFMAYVHTSYYCPECQYQRKLERGAKWQKENGRRTNNDHIRYGFYFTGLGLFVVHDPIEVDEGGFRKGAFLGSKMMVKNGARMGVYAEGMVLEAQKKGVLYEIRGRDLVKLEGGRDG